MKAYDNLDRGQLLQTLAGYRAGPKLWRLLGNFWSHQEEFTRQNGFHGPQLRATRGTQHGLLASPTLFNMAVDSVVRLWISLTVEDESAIHEVLGMAVGRCMGVFYADDGLVGWRYP